MQGHSRKATALIGLFSLGLMFPATAHAARCEQAETQYKAAQEQPSRAESLLTNAVLECPRHAGALNNLAVIRESQGRLDEALALYRRAIDAEPDGAVPYAGLGDILMMRKNPAEAAQAYQIFLAKLRDEKLNGDPSGLAAHEADYQRRLQSALSQLRPEKAEKIVVFKQNIVVASTITRSLTTKPKKPRFRGLGLAARTEPSIDIQILFDFNSDGIKKISVATFRNRQGLEVSPITKLPYTHRRPYRQFRIRQIQPNPIAPQGRRSPTPFDCALRPQHSSF